MEILFRALKIVSTFANTHDLQHCTWAEEFTSQHNVSDLLNIVKRGIQQDYSKKLWEFACSSLTGIIRALDSNGGNQLLNLFNELQVPKQGILSLLRGRVSENKVTQTMQTDFLMVFSALLNADRLKSKTALLLSYIEPSLLIHSLVSLKNDGTCFPRTLYACECLAALPRKEVVSIIQQVSVADLKPVRAQRVLELLESYQQDSIDAKLCSTVDTLLIYCQSEFNI